MSLSNPFRCQDWAIRVQPASASAAKTHNGVAVASDALIRTFPFYPEDFRYHTSNSTAAPTSHFTLAAALASRNDTS